MKQTEIEFVATEAEIAARPRKQRWVLGGMLTFCALLMGAVIISKPHMVSLVDLGSRQVSGIFFAAKEVTWQTGAVVDTIAEYAVGAPDARVQVHKPMVGVMPKNRTPVRRAGVTALD